MDRFGHLVVGHGGVGGGNVGDQVREHQVRAALVMLPAVNGADNARVGGVAGTGWGIGDLDEYFVWPATKAALAWEREQWAIFVEWNTRYEAGTATVDSHPGHRGVNTRYDDLDELLTPHRRVPDDARRLVAEWRWLPGTSRYHANGVDYRVRWRPT